MSAAIEDALVDVAAERFPVIRDILAAIDAAKVRYGSGEDETVGTYNLGIDRARSAVIECLYAKVRDSSP